MNLLHQARQLIMPIIWKFWDVWGLRYEESNQKCGLQECDTSIMTMHQLTQLVNSRVLGKTFDSCSSTPSCSADLPPQAFCLFPRLKLILKGIRFYKVEDVMNTTNEVRVIPQVTFEQCF